MQRKLQEREQQIEALVSEIAKFTQSGHSAHIRISDLEGQLAEANTRKDKLEGFNVNLVQVIERLESVRDDKIQENLKLTDDFNKTVGDINRLGELLKEAEKKIDQQAGEITGLNSHLTQFQ